MPCVFFVGTDSRSNSQSDGSKALLLSNQMMLYNRYQMLIIYISLLFPELIHRGRRTDIDVRPIPLLTLCVYIYIYIYIYTHVLMLVCWLCAPSRTMFLPSWLLHLWGGGYPTWHLPDVAKQSLPLVCLKCRLSRTYFKSGVCLPRLVNATLGTANTPTNIVWVS